MAVGGQIHPPGGPPQRLIVGRVDGYQPGDERIVQLLQLALTGVGVGGEHPVDLGLDHPAHAAHRLVLGQTDHTVAVVLIQPGQRQRQQRQRVGAGRAVGQQPVDELRCPHQPGTRLGRPCRRAADDLPELRLRHRLEVVEHPRIQPGQLRGGLQRFVAVRADGGDHDDRQLRCSVAQHGGDDRQEIARLVTGLCAEQFLGLIDREHNRRRHRVRGIDETVDRGPLRLGQPPAHPG